MSKAADKREREILDLLDAAHKQGATVGYNADLDATPPTADSCRLAPQFGWDGFGSYRSWAYCAGWAQGHVERRAEIARIRNDLGCPCAKDIT